MKLNRTQYWILVSNELASLGLRTASRKNLDPETIEVLAENNGSFRRNIPDPINMARNCLEHRFYPRGD